MPVCLAGALFTFNLGTSTSEIQEWLEIEGSVAQS